MLDVLKEYGRAAARLARDVVDLLALIGNAPVPGWLARWMPSFMLASPSERERADRAAQRLKA